MRTIAVADAKTSRQPRLPHVHATPPKGSTHMCPISAAAPSTPRHNFPSRMMPPPTPVPSVKQMIVLQPTAAPCHISPTAAAFASFSSIAGRSSTARQSRRRAENRRDTEGSAPSRPLLPQPSQFPGRRATRQKSQHLFEIHELHNRVNYRIRIFALRSILLEPRLNSPLLIDGGGTQVRPTEISSENPS